jgi:hypothetical protein
MAYGFVQAGFNYNTAGSSAGLASSAITVTAGNTLLCWIFATGNGVGQTPTGNGNTFVSVFATAQMSGTAYLQCWICQNANAGSTAITQGVGPAVYGIYVEELSGLVTTGGVLGSNSAIQNLGVTGANILSPGNVNVTSVPAGVFGFSVSQSAYAGGGNVGDPQTGTSLAYNGRAVGWLGSSSNNTAQAEDIRVTSIGNIATTFGITNDQFNQFATGMVAIAEAGAASNAAPIAWLT